MVDTSLVRALLSSPLSEVYRDYSTHVVLRPGETGLGYTCAAKCELITTTGKELLDMTPIDRLGRDRMRDIEKGIMQAIGVPA